MTGRRLLVTGARGMLGTTLLSLASEEGWLVRGVDLPELDICDEQAVAQAFSEFAPDVVINCAAWTDVDAAETNREGAFLVNATGAGVLARAAAGAGARLIQVSTDYVFDGHGTRAYVESDRTGPVGVYGASKLEGERQVLAASEQHAVVRTAWLFGAGGRNFVDTMLRLADGGAREVSVVTDQLGCPTWTGHLSQALLQVAEAGGSGVFHAAGGGSCTWNDLAVQVFALAGRDVTVLASTSGEQARAAARPPFSVLASERQDALLLAGWREGVRGYLSASGRLAASGGVDIQATVGGSL